MVKIVDDNTIVQLTPQMARKRTKVFQLFLLVWLCLFLAFFVQCTPLHHVILHQPTWNLVMTMESMISLIYIMTFLNTRPSTEPTTTTYSAWAILSMNSGNPWLSLASPVAYRSYSGPSPSVFSVTTSLRVSHTTLLGRSYQYSLSSLPSARGLRFPSSTVKYATTKTTLVF